jgi:hypothetical protein
MPEAPVETASPAAAKPRRWRRRLRRAAVATLLLMILAATVVGFLIKDHVRTLRSLRRIPGTNAFVMDYYVDYHIDKIRDRGMDVHHIEDSCISTLFPDFIVPIAIRVKHAYLSKEVKTVEDSGHHCSTVALRSNSGHVFFGRNFDYSNDACLILRVHDRGGLASISVIDLAYLNMNRAHLDQTRLIERIPLLFAPYYVMDGMNRHGVTIAHMSVPHAEPPVDPKLPAIAEATLERLVLDYAKDADEAVELMRAFNVHFVVARVHVMVADASGRSRIVEFLDGHIRVTPGKGSWQISTNDIVWNRSAAVRGASCRRYRAGADAAEKLAGVFDCAAAQKVVRSMSVNNWTMWTSVYDLTAGKVRVLYKSRPDLEYRDEISRPKGSEPSPVAKPAARPATAA